MLARAPELVESVVFELTGDSIAVLLPVAEGAVESVIVAVEFVNVELAVSVLQIYISLFSLHACRQYGHHCG